MITDFVKLHELVSVHLLGLIEWNESNLIRRKGLVGEWAFDFIQVMRSD
jgi:hypothetical protein